ncbi:MAG: PIN domain-containing protein [Salinibacter sp.]
MHVLFDTNVLLDALLERQHADEAYYLLDQSLEGPLRGAVTPTVLINTFYVGRKEVGRESTTLFIRELLDDLTILSVSGSMLRRALQKYTDFEDGAIGEAAEASDVDVICSRNETDFQSSAVPVLSPQALIRALQS